MRLSTRTRYGIRAVLELARNYGNGPLQIKTIAARQKLSPKYLEQLMATLKSAGIVRSIRGSKGGYILARPPEEIKVSQCFDCLEGRVITIECVTDNNYCSRMDGCVARGLWTQVQNAVMNVLESMTLKDLVDKAKKGKALNYSI
ncbi:RrF2 family transcriptional regulator [Planctomycetota bacterium]